MLTQVASVVMGTFTYCCCCCHVGGGSPGGALAAASAPTGTIVGTIVGTAASVVERLIVLCLAAPLVTAKRLLFLHPTCAILAVVWPARRPLVLPAPLPA